MNRATIFAVLALATAAPASAADLRVAPPAQMDAVEALCANPRILARIKNRFAWAEHHTWKRGFVMAELSNPRLNRSELDGPSLIAQVRCIADAAMTDGSQRAVFYTVEAEMGFASIGKGVDFCVLGLDPWYVHDDACRTVR